jgi:DNA-binding NtrC family response regulator
MLNPHPVLIVSSNPAQRGEISELARRCKLEPVLAPSLGEARRMLLETHPLVVLCGDELDDSNMTRAVKTLRYEADAPVIVLSRRAEWGSCVEACTAGAFDYLAVPPDKKETRRVMSLALQQFRREHRHPHAA